MRKLLYILLCGMLASACTKEIDFDFQNDEPAVVIEGKVTNQGRWVVISRSRSVTDSVHTRCLPGASVMITCGDSTTVLDYDVAKDCYYSDIPGVPGQTYRMLVEFEGKQYVATATMQGEAPIVSSEFYWLTMVGERVLFYEMWAKDLEPDVRNYYMIRIKRQSHHPHFEGKHYSDLYGWDVFDDRGCPPGMLFIDWAMVSEQVMDDDKKDDWKQIVYDGDSISVELMTVDHQVYNYLNELRSGQNNGVNPRSNISGGCLGYFAAGTVTRTAPVVFRRNDVSEWRNDMKSNFLPFVTN